MASLQFMWGQVKYCSNEVVGRSLKVSETYLT